MTLSYLRSYPTDHLSVQFQFNWLKFNLRWSLYFLCVLSYLFCWGKSLKLFRAFEFWLSSIFSGAENIDELRSWRAFSTTSPFLAVQKLKFLRSFVLSSYEDCIHVITFVNQVELDRLDVTLWHHGKILWYQLEWIYGYSLAIILHFSPLSTISIIKNKFVGKKKFRFWQYRIY